MRYTGRSVGFGLVLLVALLLSSACKEGPGSITNWWVGSWVLDEIHTADQYKIARETQRETTPVEGTGIGEFFSNLAGRATDDVVVSTLDNIALTITENDFVMTKEGTGTAKTYELLESPTAEKEVIKLSDGSVLTLTREGPYLTMVQDRGVPIRLYFTKVE